MKQSRKHSAIETVVQTTVAFCLSVAIQPFIYSYYDFHVTTHESVELATVFTIVSLIRSYSIRRMFVWFHK